MQGRFDHRMVGDVLVIEIKGQLDDEVRDLYDVVKLGLDEGTKKFVIDMSAVPQGNSAGLGYLVRVYTLIARSGGVVAFASPTEKIANTFSFTKLNSVFQTYPSVEQSIAAIDARAVKMP